MKFWIRFTMKGLRGGVPDLEGDYWDLSFHPHCAVQHQ